MLCLLSCSRKERLITADVIEFDSFAKEFTKISHPTGVSVMGVLGISSFENIMVAITTNPEALISIIDLDTERTLFTGMTRGRGPDEFLMLITNCQFVNRNEHPCLWVCDAGVRKCVLIDLTETVEKQAIVSSESWQYEKVYEQRSGMLILSSGERFVKFPVTYKDVRDDIRYYPKYLYFTDDNVVRELPFFRRGSFLLSESNYENASTGAFDGVTILKPDGTKAIDAFYFADHLNFLDLIENRGFSMHYSKGMSVDDLVSATFSYLRQHHVNAYMTAVVTDDYVFALYSGKQDPMPGETAPDVASSIRIFDWEGTPSALVHVDKELRSIAYDQRTKRLYALDFEENIMYYDFSDVI